MDSIMERSGDKEDCAGSTDSSSTDTPEKRDITSPEPEDLELVDSHDALPGKNPFVTVTSFGSSLSTISNDSLPHTETPSRFSRWMRDWITDWWGLEIVCWVIATISLLAIVIVLESHKSKRK